MPKSAITDVQSGDPVLPEKPADQYEPLFHNYSATSTYIRKGSWVWFVKGAMGLGKSLLGINTVSPEVRRMRMGTCIKCRHLVGNPLRSTYQVRCSICGCVAWHKANNRDEACPEGKWQ